MFSLVYTHSPSIYSIICSTGNKIHVSIFVFLSFLNKYFNSRIDKAGTYTGWLHLCPCKLQLHESEMLPSADWLRGSPADCSKFVQQSACLTARGNRPAGWNRAALSTVQLPWETASEYLYQRVTPCFIY